MKKIFFLLICFVVLWFACTSDNEPPVVEMFYPHDGDTVWATVYITARTLDNDTVARVEFFLNDSMVGTQDVVFQDSFYQYIWMTGLTGDTMNMSIYTIAYDANENNTKSNTITVYVDNAGHPPGGN